MCYFLIFKSLFHSVQNGHFFAVNYLQVFRFDWEDFCQQLKQKCIAKRATLFLFPIYLRWTQEKEEEELDLRYVWQKVSWEHGNSSTQNKRNKNHKKHYIKSCTNIKVFYPEKISWNCFFISLNQITSILRLFFKLSLEQCIAISTERFIVFENRHKCRLRKSPKNATFEFSHQK